ncbi:MAG: bifunctional [glutamate--ammonia ligase]-adenylyl-L-tyrosine phosphorylase/[glutamate--ammonia-ligase] adenylyltransferase [Cellvibrio sp.]
MTLQQEFIATHSLDFSEVPPGLVNAARNLYERYCESLYEKGLPHPITQLPDGIARDQFSRELVRVFVGSEYLAKTLIARPHYLQELVESGDLFKRTAQYPQDQSALASQTDADFDSRLRCWRQREMIRFIWRDMNRLDSMEAITQELSLFADACIRTAASYHFAKLTEIYGRPIGRESQQTQPFIVLGMGKLGAGELNLSSDIDLIFCFPESGDTDSERKSVSNQEFFVKLGQRVIKSLDSITADGFVFRVDMRLRPHGQSGPLALNFVALENYYQTQGRDWERYAMIKARTVAMVGNDNARYCVQVRSELRELLRPFTYRQYIDFSVIESLREMKTLIARQVQRKGMNLDVKLGEGGIREVEFVVQAFQLIRGGRDERLRERKVTLLLPFLEKEGLLPEGTGQALLDAYIFLRNTEHAIQAYQDQQTQSLPSDSDQQTRLAWVLGYPTWEAFFNELQAHRQRVNNEFQEVIAPPETAHNGEQEKLSIWKDLWFGILSDEEALAFFDDQDIPGGDALVQVIKNLQQSRSVQALQSTGRARLDAFIPRLLDTLVERASQGQLQLSVAECFKRIEPLIEAVVRRSAYLVLLVENPTAMSQLVTLCDASPWIADQLAQYPALLDELLTPESLYSPPDKDTLRDELRREILRTAWDDLEGHMESLRYFRLAHALRVAASEVTGALPLMKVSDYLTFIAEVILEHVLELSWQYMVGRHGYPTKADGSIDHEPDFVIVGFGKLGGIELSHGSDLDLVFIHNADSGNSDGERSIDNLTFYTRLGQRIIHILSTQTLNGKLYEVDMRLRPSGNSGLLVASLNGFERYEMTEAWTWEHQALVRARVVAGNAQLGKAFETIRHRVLTQPRDNQQLREDVAQMRRKMRETLDSGQRNRGLFNLKQGAGGIVDIEFMVQYAALAWAHQAPSIIQYTDNIRILGSLEEAGLLDADSVAHLIAAYKAYRSTGHRLALQRQEAVLEGDQQFSEEREFVTQLWHRLIEAPTAP